MRIAFFVGDFPSLSETFVLDQITGLIDRGHDVRIVARRVVPAERRQEEIERYGLMRLVRARALVERGWRRGARRIALLAANLFRHPGLILRALNPVEWGWRALTLDYVERALLFADRPAFDVVQCHFGPNGADAAILLDLGVLSGRLVTTFHGYDLREAPSDPRRYARLVRRCDCVHSISSYNHRGLEAIGFDPARIVEHPPGVDVRRFAPAAPRPPGGRVEVLSVARLVPEKGLDHALRAFAEVRRTRPDLRFRYRVVGGGPLELSLRSLAASLRLDDAVELLGSRDREFVRQRLGEADLFLLPSVAEALSVSTMEAMATGLPVIATDVGAVGDLVDERTGRLVPAGDTAALASALTGLMLAPGSWKPLGEAGRARIVERYDQDRLNDRLEQSFLALTGTRRAGGTRSTTERRAVELWTRVRTIPARLATRDSLVVFVFHQVSESFEPKFHQRSTWTSRERFERQIDDIRRGFDMLPLPEALSALSAGTLRGRCAAIAIDDGDASLERTTVPVLRRRRVPATFFVNSGYWGGRKASWPILLGYFAHHDEEARRRWFTGEMRDWFRLLRDTADPGAYRELVRRVASLDEGVDPADRFVVGREFLESLDPGLFTVGLHGHEHERFSMMPESWQWQCVDDNLAALRSLPAFRPLFAVPFGRPHDWDDTVLEIAAAHGLHLLFADGGLNRPGDVHCRRVPADGASIPHLVRRILLDQSRGGA